MLTPPLDKALKALNLNSSKVTNVSAPQDTLLQVLQALNISSLIPSAIVIALLWKLYGFFNELSEKLTRVELKIDSLDKILPYKIKECVDQMEKSEVPKHPKHNPNIGWTDWVEVVGIGFGLVNFILFFALVFHSESVLYYVDIFLLFFVTGIFGIFPIIIKKKQMPKNARALLSLLSLIPWLYIALVIEKLIPPFLG